MHNEEIDTIIDGICQEYDSISDAFDFSDEPHPECEELPEDGESPVPPDGGIGGTFRPSSYVGGFVNMFPANAYGPCRPDFLLVLPADPLRMNRSVPSSERERLRVRYFQNALRAIDRWATNCRGKNIFLLTEQWPVAPEITQSALWRSELAPQTTRTLEHVSNLLERLEWTSREWRFGNTVDATVELDRLVSSEHLNVFKTNADALISATKALTAFSHQVESASREFEHKRQTVRMLFEQWKRQVFNSPLFLASSLTFHENLQAFREAHPDVNFHIRLAAMPRQKPLRFSCLSGEVWPQI